jgi:hypothetical protein
MMCDNINNDIPPLASRVEDLEDDDDIDENFCISVGDQENDAMYEHSKKTENRGNHMTSENDTRNEMVFDDYSDNKNDNVGNLVGDRENDAARMKMFNLISSPQKQMGCFEGYENITNINSSHNDNIQLYEDNVVVA